MVWFGQRWVMETCDFISSLWLILIFVLGMGVPVTCFVSRRVVETARMLNWGSAQALAVDGGMRGPKLLLRFLGAVSPSGMASAFATPQTPIRRYALNPQIKY